MYTDLEGYKGEDVGVVIWLLYFEFKGIFCKSRIFLSYLLFIIKGIVFVSNIINFKNLIQVFHILPSKQKSNMSKQYYLTARQINIQLFFPLLSYSLFLHIPLISHKEQFLFSISFQFLWHFKYSIPNFII